MYIHVFIRSSTDGPLGCFRILAIANHAATTTGVQVSLQDAVTLESQRLTAMGRQMVKTLDLCFQS